MGTAIMANWIVEMSRGWKWWQNLYFVGFIARFVTHVGWTEDKWLKMYDLHLTGFLDFRFQAWNHYEAFYLDLSSWQLCIAQPMSPPWLMILGPSLNRIGLGFGYYLWGNFITLHSLHWEDMRLESNIKDRHPGPGEFIQCNLSKPWEFLSSDVNQLWHQYWWFGSWSHSWCQLCLPSKFGIR